jgi:hypothetical protein
MSSPSQPLDATAYEQLIFQVRGIQAARIVTDANGGIDEVHVVGLPGRSAKQIVRDIGSILYVRGGIRLDYRKVSLVQLSEEALKPLAPRVLLRDVVCEQHTPRPGVKVSLGFGERQFQGHSAAPAEGSSCPLHLAAEATLEALRQLLGPQADLRVEQVGSQPFGALRVCLSQLSLAAEGGSETLLGVSQIRGDEATAAARAVLDAVNRQLQRLLAA